MCFSAQASFITGSILIIIGLACIRRVHKKESTHLLPLAYTPLLFGIQQLLEGALWLALLSTPRNETLYTLGLNGFLWFALFWWPTWLPYTLARAEQSTLRQRIMYLFASAGAFLGLYLVWPPYSAHLVYDHIAYTTSHASIPAFFIYLLPGIVPFFISTLPYIWLIGFFAYLSLIATIIAYFAWTTSIWCFFVAVISTSVYILLRRMTRQ